MATLPYKAQPFPLISGSGATPAKTSSFQMPSGFSSQAFGSSGSGSTANPFLNNAVFNTAKANQLAQNNSAFAAALAPARSSSSPIGQAFNAALSDKANNDLWASQQASMPKLSGLATPGPAYNPTDSSKTRGLTGSVPSSMWTGPNPTGTTAPTGAAQTRTSTMPTGFAPTASQPATATPDYSKSNAGGLEYTPHSGQGQTHSSVTGPGALQKGVPGANTKTATDQWGRTFYYNDAQNLQSHGGTQPVVGVSNTGTVLREITMSDGRKVTYDTGVAAFTPVTPTRAPVIDAPPPVVGRPTQTGQPVSTPVVNPRPSAWAPPPPAQPSQDDIDAENQGRWLG